MTVPLHRSVEFNRVIQRGLVTARQMVFRRPIDPERLHVDDLANACVFLMKNYSEKQFLNIGSGEEISIKNLAILIKKIVGFDGEFIFDHSKPDGTPRKFLDSSKITQLGWKPEITLETGIIDLYKKYF